MDGFRSAFQVSTWERAMRYALWLGHYHGRYNPNFKPAVKKMDRPAELPWLTGWVPK